MASLPGWYNQQFFKDNGDVAANWRVYTYAAGTTTHKVAYIDAAGVTPQTYTSDGLGGQYIALNARGELAAPLFLGTGAYDIVLKDDTGATEWTRYAIGTDENAVALQARLAATTSGNGASMVGVYDAANNWASTTAETVLAEVATRIGQVAILATEPRFGAVADSNGTAGNGTDNTAAFTAAIAYAVENRCTLIIPSGNGLMYRHTGPLPVLVASLASGVRKGVIIEGTGPGSIIFNDSVGDSFVLDSTSGAADMGTQIKIRNLSFVSNTGKRPTSFVRNKKGINTEVSDCHFMSVFMAAGGGCVINEVAYGMRYINNIHRGVVGDALVLRNTIPESSGYSYVATVERCDFSFCTRGIYAEGTNCLNVRDCVFGENTDSGIVVDPTVNGVFGFNIDIATSWFEKNTNYDIDLRSTTSYWCEGAIRHCQFGGFSPAFVAHINLGAKSRVYVIGTPTGNTVEVSGNTVASFYGIGTVPKFTQVGSFYWNEYDYAGGYNTPALDISSTGDIIANTGGFISSKGTTAVPNAVATTLFTMPSSANGVYLLTTTAGTSGPAAWTVVAIISCSASLGQLTVLQTSTNLTITRSGLNIQGTQSTGGSVNVSWAVTRLLA